jgi:hypothetical protein
MQLSSCGLFASVSFLRFIRVLEIKQPSRRVSERGVHWTILMRISLRPRLSITPDCLPVETGLTSRIVGASIEAIISRDERSLTEVEGRKMPSR